MEDDMQPNPKAPADQMHTGWSTPRPETLPQPTVWPVVMALGITLLLWGLLTNIILLGMGAILFTIALAGWIGELRHEQGEPNHDATP